MILTNRENFLKRRKLIGVLRLEKITTEKDETSDCGNIWSKCVRKAKFKEHLVNCYGTGYIEDRMTHGHLRSYGMFVSNSDAFFYLV